MMLSKLCAKRKASAKSKRKEKHGQVGGKNSRHVVHEMFFFKGKDCPKSLTWPTETKTNSFESCKLDHD